MKAEFGWKSNCRRLTFNQHYGKEFTRPRIRNWLPTQDATTLASILRDKVPARAKEETDFFKNWKHLAMWDHGKHENQRATDPVRAFVFWTTFPGPMTIGNQAQPERGMFDVNWKLYKKAYPKEDWEKVFAHECRQDR